MTEGNTAREALSQLEGHINILVSEIGGAAAIAEMIAAMENGEPRNGAAYILKRGLDEIREAAQELQRCWNDQWERNAAGEPAS